MKKLILGGIRSGKSRYAQQLALNTALPVTYIATATIEDEEMAKRIEAHRANRPKHWKVIEEPLALAKVIKEEDKQNQCLIVDCLTLWLTNLLCKNPAINEHELRKEYASLSKILQNAYGHIILISNEVNMSIIPNNPLSRRFIDEIGHLHQILAEICDNVIWMVAGLPQILKTQTEKT